MIKKVSVDDLRVGVYVTDFNTPIAHKGSIYIEPGPISRESTIKILKSWGVGQVDIDTSLGLDPETLPKNKKRKVKIAPKSLAVAPPTQSLPAA